MLDSGPLTLYPAVEQQHAVELFIAGGNLRIDAYAGTGKTTTLRLLAARKPGRALHLAFKSIDRDRSSKAFSRIGEMRHDALGGVPGSSQEPWVPSGSSPSRSQPT